MEILIIGGSGMLGHKLAQKFTRNFKVWATLRGPAEEYQGLKIFEGVNLIEKIDVEKIESVAEVVKKVNPKVIINAVGVIKQLPEAKNIIKTLTINSIFPHQLSEISRKNKARLINISTDCVFKGDKGEYTEEDLADALDLYGKSKNLGEVAEKNCLTLRTSIIGRELFSAHSLVEWFLSRRGNTIKGFKKAIYTGFPTVVLAGILENLILNHPNLSGLYHVSSNKISKFELLELINQEFGAGVEIEPEEEFVLDRSLDSTKFRKATGFEPPEWAEMIKAMAEDAKVYEILKNQKKLNNERA